MKTIPDTPKKLREAVKLADTKLAATRRHRGAMLREYCGPYYGGAGSAGGEAGQPINTLYMLVSVLVPNLVFRNPRATVTSHVAARRAQAHVNGLRMDRLFGEIDLAASLRTVVTDAMFGPGIVKTGIAPGAEVPGLQEAFGYLHDVGQPYCDHVDLDDYVIDPLARRREEAWFEGSRYRLPKRYLLESGLYDRKLIETLQPVGRRGPKRAEDLSWGRAAPAAANDLGEMIELYDLWLPHADGGNGAIVTVAADLDAGGAGEKFLREVAWDGPERGPYEMLGFHWVPGNVLPLAPTAVLYDLHRLINDVARKLARQAQRQKDLLLVEDKVDERELTAVADAPDGGMVRVQNRDRYAAVSFGGAARQNHEALAFLLDQQSRVAGNIDLLGGTRAQSPTATQDQILTANGMTRVQDYQTQVYDFVRRVVRKLAWYVWTDPLQRVALTQNVAGMPVAVEFAADDRDGEFDDFVWDIEPYSMAPDSPDRQFNRTVNWFERIILPSAQYAAAAGQAMDVTKLAEITSRQLNVPHAEEIFQPSSPAQDAMPPIRPGAPRKAGPAEDGHVGRGIRAEPA